MSEGEIGSLSVFCVTRGSQDIQSHFLSIKEAVCFSTLVRYKKKISSLCDRGLHSVTKSERLEPSI